MLALSAAFQNQPPMWLSTASLKMRSRPTRASSTFCGTLPLRKPGTFVLAARSDDACSTACFTCSLGTSTSRRTRLSGSSSTLVFTVGPFCQQVFGLGLRLKQGLIGADFMKVRGAAYFGLAAAVALFVHPADTGDLSFFVHTSQKLPWNWFADPSVQAGPLQLLILRVGDLVGALPLVIEVGCAGLIWVVAGRLVGRRAQLIVSLAAVALGLTYSAYTDGHPAQLVAPLLGVLAALEVRRGRGVR